MCSYSIISNVFTTLVSLVGYAGTGSLQSHCDFKLNSYGNQSLSHQDYFFLNRTYDKSLTSAKKLKGVLACNHRLIQVDTISTETCVVRNESSRCVEFYVHVPWIDQLQLQTDP